MPENICFMNTNKPWGGGEKWNHDFALLMRDRGYDVHVICNKPSELAERLKKNDGIHVVQIHVTNVSFLCPRVMPRLWYYFKKHKIKTLVTALPNDLKAGGLAAKAAGVPDIIYRRGIAVPVKNTFLNRFLLGKVITKLIYNSECTKNKVLEHNPDMIPNDRTHLVHNGFDVAEFDARPATEMIRKNPGQVVIGTAGRLTGQKGHKLLIDAAKILKQKGLDFKVVIAGKGDLEEDLKTYTRENGLEDAVQFLGFVTDMKSFNNSIDIFALPSLWEGFGYAQVEAMTLEKPVVAFDVSSIPEVVSDRETGLLAPKEDVAAFAAHLEKLIMDEELRERLGKAGRKRVLDNFEINKTLDDFLNVINK